MASIGPEIPLRPLDPNTKVQPEIKQSLKIQPVHTPKTADIAQTALSQIRKATPFSDVKRVPYISLEVLLEKLQPGDIFLSYYPENTDAIAAGLRAGQMLGKIVTPVSTEESHNFVHVAFYVGDGKLSEAVGDGVRINQIDSERFKLKPGMSHGFLVVRPTNRAMAEEACKIAEELSAKHEAEPATHKYSIGKAILSGLSKGSLDQKGLARYLKGACYAHNKIQPMSKNGIREFFCSYFVGWACQAGESLDVLQKVNNSLPANEKITFPDLTHIDKKHQGRALSDWANTVVKKHGERFKEHIKLDFDPKLTSPQRLYGFFMEHPELFSQEMLIVAPSEETEMKSFKHDKHDNPDIIE